MTFDLPWSLDLALVAASFWILCRCVNMLVANDAKTIHIPGAEIARALENHAKATGWKMPT